MKRGGVSRTLLDKKDLSFHRSFGTVAAPLTLLEYNYDVGKTMPDQNADGFPLGCRAYALVDIAGDEDDSIYKPKYTCDKIAYYEGTPQIQGGDIRIASKVGEVYGVQRLDETTDEEAETHRRGVPFNVDFVPGYDWFDSFRSALRTGKRSISVGTIWFQEWELTGQDGILTPNFVFDGTWDTEGGHNYKISGEIVRGGYAYLCAKTWQGTGFGDKGWCYFSREAFNKAFDIYGTIGLIQPAFQPKDTFSIQLTIFQFILQYFGRLIGLKTYS